MKFIIGKKIEMTQIWQGDKVTAVTKVQAGPCQVMQIKNLKKDGYEAVQIGYGERKTKNIRKPQLAHQKKAGVNIDSRKAMHYLREFRGEKISENLEAGDIIKADTFQVGDKITIVSTSKGKGFQGVVKRHGFKGTNEQHGNKDQSRMPGSIGAKGPAHVFKGTRMGGRMGGDRVTMRTLEVIQVDEEKEIIYIKGGVPGARNALVLISGEGELKSEKPLKKQEEVKQEEVKEGAKIEEKEIAVQEKEEVKKEASTEDEVEKEVIEAKEKVDKESSAS